MSIRPVVGCGTALLTPFTSDGQVDEGALRALVEWQLSEGVHFLVPCGSTGEAATFIDQASPFSLRRSVTVAPSISSPRDEAALRAVRRRYRAVTGASKRTSVRRTRSLFQVWSNRGASAFMTS